MEAPKETKAGPVEGGNCQKSCIITESIFAFLPGHWRDHRQPRQFSYSRPSLTSPVIPQPIPKNTAPAIRRQVMSFFVGTLHFGATSW